MLQPLKLTRPQRKLQKSFILKLIFISVLLKPNLLMRKVKKEFSEKYDLVIGNPPYGEHRGLYKGLGEEPKISKYEDYFVKRSLDSLKPEGILAMVLPSGWLNRQSQLKMLN